MTSRLGRRSPLAPPAQRPRFSDLEKANQSMMGESLLPIEYNHLADGRDVLDHVVKPEEDSRVARMYIVWDNPVSGLADDVEQVLDLMRQSGAAFITDAKLVTR